MAPDHEPESARLLPTVRHGQWVTHYASLQLLSAIIVGFEAKTDFASMGLPSHGGTV
jgi:hypothetical protein